MLTTRHLAVIRAALKFWDEEMSPHGENSFPAYFDDPKVAGELTNEDVTHTRNQLDQCEVRYALCNHAATALVGGQLFQDVEEALRACDGGTAKIVTVLKTGSS